MPDFQFQSLAEFLSMGGHALYVWSSYAIFAAMIAFNLIQPVLAKRRIFREQRARLTRESVRQATEAARGASMDKRVEE